MEAHTFYLRAWQRKADLFLVQGQPRIYDDFHANQGYIVSPYLKNKSKQAKENETKAGCHTPTLQWQTLSFPTLNTD